MEGGCRQFLRTQLAKWNANAKFPLWFVCSSLPLLAASEQRQRNDDDNNNVMRTCLAVAARPVKKHCALRFKACFASASIHSHRRKPREDSALTSLTVHEVNLSHSHLVHITGDFSSSAEHANLPRTNFLRESDHGEGHSGSVFILHAYNLTQKESNLFPCTF